MLKSQIFFKHFLTEKLIIHNFPIYLYQRTIHYLTDFTAMFMQQQRY